MRRESFSPRQVFVIALAVGLAVALLPQAVDAASKAFRLVGKNGRTAQVDKKGSLSVAVKNRPAVKVPDGVAVTNQPAVKVPEGVAVTNQPSVKVPDGVTVTNEPAVKVPGGVAVRAQPGEVSVEARPSTRDVVNAQGSRLGVGWVLLLSTAGEKRTAVTEVSITAQGPGGVQTYRIESWVRKGSTGSCTSPNLGEFDRHIHRQVAVQNYETVQLTFPDAPLLVAPPTAEGRLSCFGVVSSSAPNDSSSFFGASGFTY